MNKFDRVAGQAANGALLVGIWAVSCLFVGLIAKAIYKLFMLGWNVF